MTVSHFKKNRPLNVNKSHKLAFEIVFTFAKKLLTAVLSFYYVANSSPIASVPYHGQP